MRKLLLLIGCLLMFSMSAFAVGSPYTAVVSGNWDVGTTWGNVGNTPGIHYPITGQIATLGNGALINVTVTIPASFSASITTLTISIGSNLTIASTGTLSLDGLLTLGDDGLGGVGTLNISGTLTANQGSSFVGDSNLNTTILSGGKYSHNFTTTAGNILRAAWNTGSTCEVIGYTTNATAPGFINQSFYHFTWNCPNGPSTYISFAGGLGSIAGNFTVSATGTGSGTLRLFDTSSNGTLSVSGNIIVNGSGRLVFSTTGTANTVTVGGNFSINNTVTSTSTMTTAGSATLTVNGNFSMAPTVATTFNLASTTGTGTFNLLGSLSINSLSTLTSGASATAANLNFSSSTIQSFANSGTFGKINLTVNSLATLDVGTSAITGTGVFTLNGTLRVGSTDPLGPLQLNTSAGNLQVPTGAGFRVFNPGSTITYNGLSTQTIGDGHPTGSGITTRINNAAGVSLSTNLVIVGTIILDNGNLSVGSNTLTMNGTFTPNLNSLVTTVNSNISIGGTGAFGTLSLSGSTTINSFVLNRTSSGTVTLGSAMTIKNFGTLTQQAGSLILNGKALTISGDFSQSAGTITADAAASLTIDGSGTLPVLISLSGSSLNSLSIIRTTPAVAMAPNITVTNLNLTDGTLSNTGAINMATGGTITVVAGTMTGTAVGGSSYNVIYNNTSALVTGSELPSSTTALNNLTKSSGGTLTLSNAVTVNGTLTLSGAFNSNSKAVNINGNVVFNVAPTFTTSTVTFSGTTAFSGAALPIFGNMTITNSLTPSINYQVNGNLINSGTLNNGTVTTSFGGNTTISGTSTSSFYNLTINTASTLVAPPTFNVAGTWTNSGTFTAGTGTVVFNGTSTIGGSTTTNFYHVTISGTLTGPTTLNVAGNFTNNNTFTAGSGTVVLNGSTGQSIQGSANANFNNLTSSNASTVTVVTAQSLTGALTLSAGTFNANGNLTLVSNASGDARVAQITGGASITGNVIAQRYLPNTTTVKAYRYLASPVTNGVASAWKAKFPITGTFTDPSTQAEWPAITGLVQASPSMYIYNESHAGAVLITDKYETFPPNGSTSTSTTLVNGKGYAGYVRQTAPITLDVTGTPQQGNVPIAVTALSAGGIDGWNLIGNPYPAPINWDNVTVPGGVGAQISFKDNTNNIGLGAGAYVYFTKGTPGTGIPASFTGTIPSGQAFWVHATANATITFAEANKQAIANPKFIRVGTTPDIVRVNISGNGKIDEIVIRFIDGGSDASDNTYDALKLKNDYINLSSLSSDDKKMAINGMGTLSCFKQVSLVVEGVTPGTHTFNFSQFDSFSNQMQIRLLDTFTGTSFVVNQTSSVYNFDVTSDPASFGSNRFKMVFGEVVPTITPVNNTRCGAGTVDLTSSGAQNGNYRWYELETGGSPIPGATSSTFTTPTLIKTKTFYVASTNSVGCEGMRIPVVANVTNLDPVVITVNGQKFESSYTQGNQWYLNGQPIPGATSQTFVPQQSGVYLVQITSSNCITFAAREFVITGLEESLPSHITIFPNPTSGSISVAVKSSNEVNAKLVSLMGITIQDKLLEGASVKRGAFNLEEQSEGMYILIVQDGSQVYKTRIIKKR